MYCLRTNFICLPKGVEFTKPQDMEQQGTPVCSSNYFEGTIRQLNVLMRFLFKIAITELKPIYVTEN
jgi:hypothetical protein